MALQKILKDDDTARRRLYQMWKRLVAEALRNESLWASDDRPCFSIQEGVFE
jgi:hypothetical protein